VKTLVLKLNATGDVLRTTTLLRVLGGQVVWVTAPENVELLDGAMENVQCVAWQDRSRVVGHRYDLVINLEDDAEVAAFLRGVHAERLFGAYCDGDGALRYTADAREWFDMSLISTFGRQCADELKLQNREPYQALLFRGLGRQFRGDRYVMPRCPTTDLLGDVAIAPVAGPVWPMKNWAYYDELAIELRRRGLVVNVLPRRRSLIEHFADIIGHRCLVSGDSLPMHVALGAGIQCVTIFNCTSPWEIHDYGVQTKIVSPLLEQFFYKRGMDPRATRAISVEEVLDAVRLRLAASTGAGADARASAGSPG
jgi:ADP-heptose:LPS heptosyltransferase